MNPKKLSKLIFLSSFSLFVACQSTEEKEGDEIIDPVVEVTDLSAEGMANCYIVTAPGMYKFKADNQFNLGPGLPVPPEISPVSAGLVWQTEQGSVRNIGIDTEDCEYIAFEVVEAKGNALIAAYDETGEIVWSWHIWMPLEEVRSVKTATGYEVMTLNLGALNNTPGDPASYGMLYQWGRKDPMPAAATSTGDTSTIGAPLYTEDGSLVSIVNSSWYDTEANTLSYSIANPTVCLSNYAQISTSRDWLREEESNNALWGNPEGDYRDSETNTYPNKGVKTCYDPSPAGWRVAPADVFRDFTSNGGYAWDYSNFNIADITGDGETNLDDYNFGWHFIVNAGQQLYFPAAARYDGSYGMLMGSVSGLWGSYWSNAPYSSEYMTGGALSALAFQVKDMNGNDMVTISPSAAGSKADAYSIRCIRE